MFLLEILIFSINLFNGNLATDFFYFELKSNWKSLARSVTSVDLGLYAFSNRIIQLIKRNQPIKYCLCNKSVNSFFTSCWVIVRLSFFMTSLSSACWTASSFIWIFIVLIGIKKDPECVRQTGSITWEFS